MESAGGDSKARLLESSLPLHLWLRGNRCPDLVIIAIRMLQAGTTACWNTFHPSVFCLHIKDASRPDENTSNMHSSGMQMGRTDSFYEGTGLETLYPRWTLRSTSRETIPVYVRHLPLLSSSGLNQPGPYHLERKMLGRRIATAGSIYPVRFGEGSILPIPFCESS